MTEPTNPKPAMRFGIGCKTSIGFASIAIVEDRDTRTAALQLAESADEEADIHTSTHFFLTPAAARTLAAALTAWATETELEDRAQNAVSHLTEKEKDILRKRSVIR